MKFANNLVLLFFYNYLINYYALEPLLFPTTTLTSTSLLASTSTFIPAYLCTIQYMCIYLSLGAAAPLRRRSSHGLGVGSPEQRVAEKRPSRVAVPLR